jgi:hypothetical protein
MACARKTGEILRTAAALVDGGKLRPRVSRVLAGEVAEGTACSGPAM